MAGVDDQQSQQEGDRDGLEAVGLDLVGNPEEASHSLAVAAVLGLGGMDGHLAEVVAGNPEEVGGCLGEEEDHLGRVGADQ